MPGIDRYDDGSDKEAEDPLIPLNIKKKPTSQTAVAIQASDLPEGLPQVVAAGRGKLAEQILQLALSCGIRVREDGALAEMLATIELESPIPSEAFMAVAEILSYVYRANGAPNPFDAVLKDVMDGTPPPPPRKGEHP